MTENQKNWLYVIFVIVIPFIFVHSFTDSLVPRLLSVLWVATIFPLIIIVLLVTTRNTIRLKNYSNPVVEKRITFVAKLLAVFLAIGWIWYFTIPVWSGTYKVYALKQPFVVVVDSVSNQSATVLATGLYWNLKLSQNPTIGYMYLFPTKYRFGDSQYEFIILQNTNIILDVE